MSEDSHCGQCPSIIQPPVEMVLEVINILLPAYPTSLSREFLQLYFTKFQRVFPSDTVEAALTQQPGFTPKLMVLNELLGVPQVHPVYCILK